MKNSFLTILLLLIQHFHSDVQAHRNELVTIQMSSDILSGLDKRASDNEGEQAVKVTSGIKNL